MKRDVWVEDEVQSNSIKKYALWSVIAILVILSFFIIRDYIIPLISAFILAYLAKPLYSWFNKKFSNQISAAFCIVIIILVIVIPLTLLIGSLANIASQSISIEGLSNIESKISSLPLLKNIDVTVLNEKLTSVLISIVTSTLRQIPSLALTLLITLLGVYFILLNWPMLAANLKKYLPFKDKTRIASEIGAATHNIIYGYLLIAIIEFIIAAVGFSISGVSYALIYATIIAIFAFVPGVGPGAVWILLAIFHLFSQDYTAAIGIIITGLVISFGVDTFLVVKVVGSKSRIHPLILLVGILGGVPLFGIFGFIIGPLVLVYTIKLIEEAFR
jgi:predicted PurR-regulated permease PerM